jgi:hypothetical protein
MWWHERQGRLTHLIKWLLHAHWLLKVLRRLTLFEIGLHSHRRHLLLESGHIFGLLCGFFRLITTFLFFLLNLLFLCENEFIVFLFQLIIAPILAVILKTGLLPVIGTHISLLLPEILLVTCHIHLLLHHQETG